MLHVIIAETACTDAVGMCEIEETLNPSEGISDIVVIFEVSVADLATIFATYQKTPPNDIANVNLVSDNLILTMPEATPRGARWVDNVVIYRDGELTLVLQSTLARQW